MGTGPLFARAKDKTVVNDNGATRTKGKRARQMTGRQVQQTMGTGETFPTDQHQYGCSVAPPIKRRRVSSQDDQPRAMVSPEEPVTQNCVIPPSMMRYRETLAYFKPGLYDQLLVAMDCKELSLDILEAATQMLETCKSRDIQVKPSLFCLLKFHDIPEHHSELKQFFEKCNVFFADLNLEVTRDTTCLSSMLNTARHYNIARISDSFVKRDDDDIRQIARGWWIKHISSIYSGRGMPTATEVNDFVRWLPPDEKKSFLKLASRMFTGSGLPRQKVLDENEKILWRCFNGQLTNNSGDTPSVVANHQECLFTAELSDTVNDHSQMKALALFCVAPKKWRMEIAEFKQFLVAHKSAHSKRTAECSLLQSLLVILTNHGGPGLRLWLEEHDKRWHLAQALTEALSIKVPLNLAKFALTHLPVAQWQEYIELCNNLKPAPDKTQWDAWQPLRQQLDQRFKYRISKRMILEILWPQSEENRARYVEQMDRLFTTVGTVAQIYRMHRLCGPHKMKEFLDAVIAGDWLPQQADIFCKAKTFTKQRYLKQPHDMYAANVTIKPAPLSAAPVAITQGPQLTLTNVLQRLDGMLVLEEADLELLEGFRDQMTYVQMRRLIPKFAHSIDAEKLLAWNVDLEMKKQAYLKRDPLGLELSEIDAGFLLSEPESSDRDWIAGMLQEASG